MMKKPILLIASLAFAALLALSGCSPNATPAEPTAAPGESPATGMPNPIAEVESAADFERLNVKIDAPEDALDVSYRIIADKTAEVRFTLDGVSYVYRSANTGTEEDISGVYTEFDERSDISVDGMDWYAIINISTNKDAGALARWQYLPVQFSLYTEDHVDPEAFAEFATDLAYRAFKDNTSLPSPAPVG
ncbi:MAG TPA: hypothetical protein VN366_04890 [Feifaniaceae bacterium]|nr:hypothetical protein [Feifaniaceae bacterium]